MKCFVSTIIIVLFIITFVCTSIASASIPVTVDNFVRAETDMTFDRFVKQGAFGKIFHIRKPTPIDKQDVIRMNRDTLYSVGVFDLSSPVTITKPETGGRFLSMQIINQDHSMLPVEHGSGTFAFSQEKIGTRYVAIIFRTFFDANNSADITAANDIQDKIVSEQLNRGTFEIPDWDEASLLRMREAINILAATRPDAKGMFGDKSKLDPISHLLGTAYGWGGNPEEAAVYENVVPDKNDGETPHTLTVSREVPVDGFVSITVYNAEGFMEKNASNAYSVNNVTAKKNPDGSVTIHFGGQTENPNYLPITKGWNYVVRFYQPREEILNDTYEFPKAVPVQ